MSQPSAPLPAKFYARPVLEVAPELIGCSVHHDGVVAVLVGQVAGGHARVGMMGHGP